MDIYRNQYFTGIVFQKIMQKFNNTHVFLEKVCTFLEHNYLLVYHFCITIRRINCRIDPYMFVVTNSRQGLDISLPTNGHYINIYVSSSNYQIFIIYFNWLRFTPCSKLMKVTHSKATILPGNSAVYISVLWNNFEWKVMQFTPRNQLESFTIIKLLSLPFLLHFQFLNPFLKKSQLMVYLLQWIAICKVSIFQIFLNRCKIRISNIKYQSKWFFFISN